MYQMMMELQAKIKENECIIDKIQGKRIKTPNLDDNIQDSSVGIEDDATPQEYVEPLEVSDLPLPIDMKIIKIMIDIIFEKEKLYEDTIQ